MATFKTFEEIKSWQLAREFCKLIHQFITRESFSRDYKLKEQINGSSGSIMDNIAEGFSRGGNKEFINFLRYSKGSAGESQSQLYRALDKKHISQEEFDNAFSMLDHINSKTQNLINYLLGSEYVGPNYKNKNDKPKKV